MPYIVIRESLYKWWVKVEGLTYTETRHLTERVGEQAERQSDMMAEFSLPTWVLLNALEGLGYKVVTSDQIVSGNGTFDIKEFVWTMYKCKEEWDHSS